MKATLPSSSKIVGPTVLAVLLITSTLVLAQSLEARITQLVITQFPEQNELARYSLNYNDTFSLSFIHSVSNTRVIDVYEVRKGRIVQIREVFKTHGAGLPSNSEEPGGLSWEMTEDGFILHMDRKIPKLVVRTDKSYQNRLYLPSKEINLNQWEDQALSLNVVSTLLKN